MQNSFSDFSLRSPSPATTRFAPPAHVRRWTGRTPLTIPLPCLAGLRIAAAGLCAPASGPDARAARP